jgi:hypothetical protein
MSARAAVAPRTDSAKASAVVDLKARFMVFLPFSPLVAGLG